MLFLQIRDLRRGGEGRLEYRMAKLDFAAGNDEWQLDEPPEFDDARGDLFPS